MQATNYHTGLTSLNTAADVQGCNFYTCEPKGNKSFAYTDTTYILYKHKSKSELFAIIMYKAFHKHLFSFTHNTVIYTNFI